MKCRISGRRDLIHRSFEGTIDSLYYCMLKYACENKMGTNYYLHSPEKETKKSLVI